VCTFLWPEVQSHSDDSICSMFCKFTKSRPPKLSCAHLVGMWLKECYYLYYCACTIGWCYTHLHVHPRSDRLLLQIFSYELWSYITFILLLVFSLWTLCVVRGQCCRKPNINRKVCQSEGLIAMCWHDCASVVSWTLTKSS